MSTVQNTASDTIPLPGKDINHNRAVALPRTGTQLNHSRPFATRS